MAHGNVMQLSFCQSTRMVNAAALAVCVFGVIGCGRPTEWRICPSDQQLKAIFNDERVALDGVVSIIRKSTGLCGIDIGDRSEVYVWYEDKPTSRIEKNLLSDIKGQARIDLDVSATDIDYCIDLLSRIKAFRLMNHESDGEVRIALYRHGTLVSGLVKGIVFRTQPPSSIVANTDAMPKNTASGVYYSTLSDNWYVELEWD